MFAYREDIKKTSKSISALLIEEYNTKKKSTKVNLLNKKDFSFAVLVDENNTQLLQTLFETIYHNNLTVYGDGSNVATRLNRTPYLGIEEGDVLVFGKDKRFDVELSNIRRSLNNEIGNTEPCYELTEDFRTILKAVKQFGNIKKKLANKYPQNTSSRSLRESMYFEGNVDSVTKKKAKSTAKVEVTVSSNWIRIGDQFIRKNAADTVKVHDEHFITTVPGFWS